MSGTGGPGGNGPASSGHKLDCLEVKQSEREDRNMIITIALGVVLGGVILANLDTLVCLAAWIACLVLVGVIGLVGLALVLRGLGVGQ